MVSLRYDFARLRAALRDDLRLPPAKYPNGAGAPALDESSAAAAAAAAVASAGDALASLAPLALVSSSSSSSSSSSGGDSNGGTAAREALKNKVLHYQRGLSEALQELLRHDARADRSDERDPEPSSMAMVVTSSYRMDSHVVGTGRFSEPFVRSVLSDVIVSAALDSEQFVMADHALANSLYKFTHVGRPVTDITPEPGDAPAPVSTRVMCGSYIPVVAFCPKQYAYELAEKSKRRQSKKGRTDGQDGTAGLGGGEVESAAVGVEEEEEDDDSGDDDLDEAGVGSGGGPAAVPGKRKRN